MLSPGPQPLGLDFTDAQQQAAMRRRSAEPWYQDAQAAIQAAEAGDDSAETRLRYMPFFYGRWDDAARADALVGFSEQTKAARLFPGWELTVQPGAGHYPWLDDPAWFTTRLLAFLG